MEPCRRIKQGKRTFLNMGYVTRRYLRHCDLFYGRKTDTCKVRHAFEMWAYRQSAGSILGQVLCNRNHSICREFRRYTITIIITKSETIWTHLNHQPVSQAIANVKTIGLSCISDDKNSSIHSNTNTNAKLGTPWKVEQHPTAEMNLFNYHQPRRPTHIRSQMPPPLAISANLCTSSVVTIKHHRHTLSLKA